MKRYAIEAAAAPLPVLTGKLFVPENEPFCDREYAAISSYVWDPEGYTPEARAYAAWDQEGIRVLLCAKEKEIVAAAKEFNGNVYQDSCLEFFLMPFPEDGRYLNFEVNAAGVALIGLGAERRGRIRLPKLPEGMNICASKHEGEWWAIAYTIPFALLEELFGSKPEKGSVMRGNFYKCDESIHPHFGSWSPIVNEKPDFHRPECFGEIVLA